ncbi:MAG: GNAT family N-acetyltransferase [Pseudonocardia sp.]|nr:GNAT family N-acetyltransferase [Pseudonocardia sp.]
MQVHPAAEPAEADRPGDGTASGEIERAGAVAADRASEKRLLEGLTVTVGPEPSAHLLAGWDSLVAGAPNSDVAQLSAWATIRRRAGYQPLYLLASSGDALLGGAALLRRRLRGLGWIGYLPYGPVLADGLGTTLRAPVRHELADALTEVARSHVALFVQPPDGGDELAIDLLHRGFRFSQAGIAPAATMRVDLAQSEADLRARLSRRLRTWTRQWPQRGVKVRVGDERDVAVLARLAASTANYQGFTPFPQDYLEATYHGLAGGGHAVLLIGEVNGVAVASELLTGSGGVLKSRITGLDRSSVQAGKLNVASAMIWEAISWGKANGYRWYDFGGLRPESVRALRAAGPGGQEGLAGPDQFKTKFGGEVYTYPPAVELIKSRVVRFGYDLARRGEGGRRLLSMIRETLRGGR